MFVCAITVSNYTSQLHLAFGSSYVHWMSPKQFLVALHVECVFHATKTVIHNSVPGQFHLELTTPTMMYHSIAPCYPKLLHVRTVSPKVARKAMSG